MATGLLELVCIPVAGKLRFIHGNLSFGHCMNSLWFTTGCGDVSSGVVGVV